MSRTSMVSRLTAECLGTFALVSIGCGAAVTAAAFLTPTKVNIGIGLFGVAAAFGATVTAMAYAVGHISGGHFNPAVTLGAALAGRIEWSAVLPYWVAQLVGGSLGGVVLYVIASGQSGFSAVESGFATNGFGALSPGGYGLFSVFLVEVVVTCLFLLVILGSTDDRAPEGFAPVAIGVGLTVLIMASVTVSNASLSPARSLAVTWFVPDALGQVWVFFLAPLAGAAIAGVLYKVAFPNTSEEVLEREEA